jgi:hypothetical protein
MNLKLKSNICITPENCYPIETEVPTWMLIILIGSSILIAKQIYDLTLN